MTTYPNGVVAALLPSVDAILGVRDSLGAVIQPISIVTRTYYQDAGKTMAGTAPEGPYFTDAVAQVLPTPKLKEFSQDIRLTEGGSVKAGDLILSGISRNKYKRQDLDGFSPSANVMKFYLIGDKLYQVINVTEKYVTFNVQVRELKTM